MFSLLESELSRGLLQAAKTRIRPPSSYKPRARDPSGSTPVPKRSRSYCSQGGKPLGRDVEGNVNLTQDSGKGPILFSARTGELRPVARNLDRGYASGGSRVPPFKSGVFGGLPSELGGDVKAFMHARPFKEIPGPTTLLQSIHIAGTRLLYHPFTNFPAENTSNMLSHLQATYGPIMRVKFGTERVVIIENLADIESLVAEAEQEYGQPACSSDSRGLMSFLKKRKGDSALSWLGGGQKTQKLRADIARHLNAQLTVGSYLSRQEGLAVDMVLLLEQLQHSPKDMQTLFYRYSVESATQMCYNRNLDLLSEPLLGDGKKKELVKSYRTVIKCLGETMTGARVLNMLFEDPFAHRFQESKQVVHEWEWTMMRESTVKEVREKAVKSLDPGESSLLLTLLDDKSLAEEDIFDAIHALMTIGSDSVASTMQMMLYALAQNADKQDKLATEILNVLGPDGCVTPKAMESLDYLKAAVKESLRLYFPVAAGGRVVLSKNIVLANYLIPAGTPVVVNSRRTAQNPVWFDHPHHYYPERWLGEAAKKIPTLAFMPFGFGSNHCPSRAFSLQELNVAIVKILQKYKVELPGDYQHKPIDTVYSLFLSPKEPLPFHFIRRSEIMNRSQQRER